jgi:predicted nucleic acid-binding protein
VSVTYLDTSVLAKILLREPDVALAEAIWEVPARRATSLITVVEARAALRAAVRGRRLQPDQLEERIAELEYRLEELAVVAIGSDVIEAAAELADAHALRALDAIHLATAAAFGDPEILFVTWDRRLALAAQALGMAVAPASILDD